MIGIADYVNDLPPGASLSSLQEMLRQETLNSPVDMYLNRIREILAYGTEARLDESNLLGRLLSLGVVSAAEAYFRAILSLSMELCPLAQASASEKSINLGGLLWHGRAGFSRSAFDHMSFANSDDLRTVSKQYIGFILDPSTFEMPLSEYDRVCHFRHGIVHGDGLMPGRNAVKLNVPRFDGPVRIVIGYKHLQEIAAVVTTLVGLYNRQLFELMCKRWAVDWRKRIDWQQKREDVLFYSLWSSFVSRVEMVQKDGRSKLRKIDCMKAVKTQYGLNEE